LEIAKYLLEKFKEKKAPINPKEIQNIEKMFKGELDKNRFRKIPVHLIRQISDIHTIIKEMKEITRQDNHKENLAKSRRR
jgi:hypothetical protein